MNSYIRIALLNYIKLFFDHVRTFNKRDIYREDI